MVGLWASLKLFVIVLHRKEKSNQHEVEVRQRETPSTVLTKEMSPQLEDNEKLLAREIRMYSNARRLPNTHRLMIEVLPVAGSPTTMTLRTMSPPVAILLSYKRRRAGREQAEDVSPFEQILHTLFETNPKAITTEDHISKSYSMESIGACTCSDNGIFLYMQNLVILYCISIKTLSNLF